MRVYEEIRLFMEMSELEQRMRLAGVIPSVEEFWRYRLGSSAVTVCMALNEFSWEDMNLPSTFYEDDDVKKVLIHTNTIISAVNDLLSVKKEIVSYASRRRQQHGGWFVKLVANAFLGTRRHRFSHSHHLLRNWRRTYSCGADR
jgi:hypothetical protein